jgi:hypothetical protein
MSPPAFPSATVHGVPGSLVLRRAAWQAARGRRDWTTAQVAVAIARKVRLMRGPTGRLVFGTWCSQWCCVAPAMTRHEPDGRSSERRASRRRCFIWNRRGEPRETLAITGSRPSSGSLPPCLVHLCPTLTPAAAQVVEGCGGNPGRLVYACVNAATAAIAGLTKTSTGCRIRASRSSNRWGLWRGSRRGWARRVAVFAGGKPSR